MFENALITRAGVDRQIDLGLLAETIFFYRSVQLVLNRSSIVALATKITADDLIALLNRAELKLSYLHPGFGVISAGLPRVHQFAAFKFAGTQRKKVPHYKDEIAISLERALGANATTRKLINTITKRAKLHRFRESAEKEKIIPDLAQSDVSDHQFVHAAVLAALRHLLPSYIPPPDFRFELFDTGQGYAVDTNLNFDQLNNIYHQFVPVSHSSLSPEYLLAHMIDARADSYFAANYMAEIVTTPVYSDIMRLKHFDFLTRRDANMREIELFQETVLQDVPSLREVVNSGEKTIGDFLKLLDKAERFREWLQNTNVDTGMISNYYQAAVEKTWADKLPTKSVRFVMATGLGLLADLAMPTGVGTAAGISLGGADSLYLDRLIKGWRPNQFIEGPYRSFVSADPTQT